ncbi:glycosyltransferase, partial [candidate division KSB1 bacterium]|nr:glycosyltransferase [candidate division KSB1 bacterium]
MKHKRILYGIQGEGRGHASRSLHIIEQLRQRGYDVCIFAGGDALSIIREHNVPFRNVPVFRFSHDEKGAVSIFRTFLSNFSQFLGVLFQSGKRYKKILREVKNFDPDFIISDFEPYLSRIAYRLGIPSMVINHQNFLIESRLPQFRSLRKKIKLWLLQIFIRLFSCKPDKIIVSAFHHFPAQNKSNATFVGPYIPENIRTAHISDGTHFTVYLKEPHYIDFILPVIRNLTEFSFEIFSNWNQIANQLPNCERITFRSISRKNFLDSLASSKALLTTAGNQVIGEAIYLQKPIFAF